MRSKIKKFQQAFSQEIPTVEEAASSFAFKKPAGIPKKKNAIGANSNSTMQTLKRKLSDQGVVLAPISSSVSSPILAPNSAPFLALISTPNSAPISSPAFTPSSAPPAMSIPVPVPAKKVKVDVIEDIPGFAATGCLHKKATVAGLKFWLNSVGIKTKSKDKKEELVKKALEKLGYATITEESMAPMEE